MQMMTKMAVAVLGVVVAFFVWPVQPAYPDSAQGAEAQTECDRYMVAHTRSAARKLGRALDRGEYGFQSVTLDDELIVTEEDLGREAPVEFEVYLEKMGEVAAIVDRRQDWEQTYVVAEAALGPIVISKTWKPRGERKSSAECRPLTSAVERPDHPATSVDVEPFRYWGLRVGWRIPSPDMIEAPDEDLEEALKQTIIDFSGKNDA